MVTHSLSTLIVEHTGPVARVILNRPEVRNAFNEVMIRELEETLRALDRDAATRVVVLAGSGKAFCAGADLNWMRAMAQFSDAENRADALRLARMLEAVYRCGKPVVARIQGDCYAGGMGLVAAADIAIAAEGAQFCLSEVRLGLIPATISPYVIEAIGARAARRYFLSAERFPAGEARALGLVHEVAPAAELDARIDALIGVLLANSPAAQRSSKELIDAVAFRPLSQDLIEDTAERIARTRASAEGREGVSAFLDKRTPSWIPTPDSQ